VIYVAIEEAVRGASDGDHVIWLVFESIFTFIFFVEFVFKLAHLKLAYFKDAWNCFDFFLVVLGFVGLALSIVAHGDGNAASEGSSETRVIRIARVLRTMRFLRFFRLLHARMSADSLVSQELQRHIKELNTLSSFVRGHAESQKALLKYFAGDIDEKNEVEMARCVLQSQVAVYQAVLQTVEVQSDMEIELVHEMQNVKKRKHVVEELEHFVESALKDGAISEKNAGSLLHPLHHEISSCLSQLDKRREGVTSIRKTETRMSAKTVTRMQLLEDYETPAFHLPTTKRTQEGDRAAGMTPKSEDNEIPMTPTAIGKTKLSSGRDDSDRATESQQVSDQDLRPMDNEDSMDCTAKKGRKVRKKKPAMQKEESSILRTSATDPYEKATGYYTSGGPGGHYRGT